MDTKFIKIIILLLSSQVFSQNQITNESLNLNGKKYNYTHLSFGLHSKSKPMKIISCQEKDFLKVKENIIKCRKTTKVDYTEFYVIPIENKDKNKNLIIEGFIKKIDSIRMANNLYTIQIKCKEHFNSIPKNNVVSYDKTALKELNEIKDLHQNVDSNTLCNLLSGG